MSLGFQISCAGGSLWPRSDREPSWFSAPNRLSDSHLRSSSIINSSFSFAQEWIHRDYGPRPQVLISAPGSAQPTLADFLGVYLCDRTRASSENDCCRYHHRAGTINSIRPQGLPGFDESRIKRLHVVFRRACKIYEPTVLVVFKGTFGIPQTTTTLGCGWHGSRPLASSWSEWRDLLSRHGGRILGNCSNRFGPFRWPNVDIQHDEIRKCVYIVAARPLI